MQVVIVVKCPTPKGTDEVPYQAIGCYLHQENRQPITAHLVQITPRYCQQQWHQTVLPVEKQSCTDFCRNHNPRLVM